MDVDLALLNPHDPAARFSAMQWLRESDPIHPVGPADGPIYLARYAAVAEALPQVDVFAGAVGAADVSPEPQALNGVPEPRRRFDSTDPTRRIISPSALGLTSVPEPPSSLPLRLTRA